MSPSQIVLLVAGLAVGLLYGVPLLVAPILWGRWFGWDAPADLRLARYFGRCLGAAVLALSVLALLGAADARVTRPALAIAGLCLLLQSAVHMVGMLERSQPRLETLEGFAWLALGLTFGWLALS